MDRRLGALSIAGRAAEPPADLDRVLRASRRERTLPVVCRNLGLPCDLFPSILAAQLLARHQAAEIAGEVEAVPLKGLDLAWNDYPAPELRDMGDLDLLVRERDLPAADRALRRLGYAADLAPGDLAGGTLRASLYHREGSLPVHLHWHLLNSSWPQFMFRPDLDEAWRDVRGGRLSREHRFLALCEHALKHSFSELIHLTDLELASRGLDWDRASETARRWGLEGAVAYALRLLKDLAGVETPGGARFALPASWEGRLFLALARRRRWDGLSGLGMLGLAGGERGRFLKGVLAPGAGESRGYRSRTVGKRLVRAAGMIWSGLTS